jgi:hypothetical protein
VTYSVPYVSTSRNRDVAHDRCTYRLLSFLLHNAADWVASNGAAGEHLFPPVRRRDGLNKQALAR